MGFLNRNGAEITFLKMQTNKFLLLKKLKNTESAQLCCYISNYSSWALRNCHFGLEIDRQVNLGIWQDAGQFWPYALKTANREPHFDDSSRSVDSVVVVVGRKDRLDLAACDDPVAEPHPDALPDVLLDLVIVLTSKRYKHYIDFHGFVYN